VQILPSIGSHDLLLWFSLNVDPGKRFSCKKADQTVPAGDLFALVFRWSPVMIVAML
jgi:hypothetical protein